MTVGDRFATMIGFAKRAGKIVYGFDCLKTAKRVAVLAVSDTASDNLKNGMARTVDLEMNLLSTATHPVKRLTSVIVLGP